MNKQYVFVYDMLRRECGNNFLLGDSRLVGEAITAESYAMYVTLIPYVVRDQAVGWIVGEVYEVDDATLHDLDRVEGHPYWYSRAMAPVILQDGKRVNAWIYFASEGPGELLRSGDYLAWLLTGGSQRSSATSYAAPGAGN